MNIPYLIALKYLVQIFIFYTFLNFECSAQDNFHKRIDLGNGISNLFDVGVRVLPIDNGYVIFAQQNSPSILYLMRYDACDQLMWQKRLDFKGVNNIAVTDQRILLLNKDALLIYDLETNKAIKVQYNRKNDFNGTSSIRLSSVGAFTDGSFFVTGFDSDSLKAFVAKYDNDAHMLWSRYYYTFNADGIYGRADKNGGIHFIVGGNFPTIFKTDTYGKVIWRHSIRYRYGSNPEVAPVAMNNNYVYAFGIDSIKSMYRIASFAEREYRPLWVTLPFKSQEIREVTYLPAIDKIVVLGSEKNLGTTITFIDSSGKGVSQSINSTTNSNITITDASVMLNSSLLIAGIEVDSSSNEHIFIRRINSQEDLNRCGFRDTLTSDSLITYNYGTGSYGTAPDSTVFQKQSKINFEEFNVEEELSCFESNPIVIEFDIGNDTTVCPYQFPFTIDCKNVYPYYNWSTGETSNSITIYEPGTYWLRAGFECNNSFDSIIISEFPLPNFHYSVEPKKATPLDKVKMKSLSINVDSVFWFLNDSLYSNRSTDSVYFNNNGKHQIIYRIRDIYGCFYSDTTSVDIEYFSYFFPNCFTPNNDGLNDIFYPQGFGIANYNISVYNRWGDLVFSSENEPWNGGKSPEGVYVYQVSIINDFEKEILEKGTFLLLR